MSYQPHSADAFYHQYSYDAENRITGVRTSTDSIEWQNDASYTYYRHGPLARVQIGDLQLQGIDYAYTVQGWLKSINPSWITPTGSTDQFDSDGVSNPALFERDAYKLNLNYFDDGTYRDFIPVNLLTGYVQGNSLLSTAKHNLYNGNIGSMAINIRQLWASPGKRDAGPMLYNYQYDQLNRISSMDAWAANGSFQPINTSPLQDYAERYTYDPNGNILTLNRNGDSTGVSMDQLSYKYIYATTGGGNGEYVPGQAPTSGVSHLTNQLSSIQDAVTGNSYTGDIKSQSAYNYTYNAIGELTGDAQQAITNVSWNVYGKILSLSDSGNTISFTYDAAGNRISKTAHGITTWYVRDAQGNVMSVYTQGNSAINSGALSQTEAHLYGSSRLGLLDLSVNCGTSLTQPTSLSLVRGNKLFELTNHLGNVLETISDKKVQHTSDNSTVDYYLADVLNANDYYSFGMGMPARSYNATTAANYRYGFNGKENDNEVKGTGNQIDYGMRMYDPRVGRFLSLDPLTKSFPSLTAFQYAGNSPIKFIDLDGAERFDPNVKPAGITLLEKATISGGTYANRTIKAGNYDLVGVNNEKGNGYWIARLTFTSGDQKGMYRDDYIVGVDGVFDFIKNAKEYEWRANMLEFVRSYSPGAGTGSLGSQYEDLWKSEASNPMTWVNIAAGVVSSLPQTNTPSLSTTSNAAQFGFEENVSIFPSLSSENDIERVASSVAKAHASNFECMECAADMVKSLKKEGIKGSVIDLNVKDGGKWTNIFSDKAGEVISTNGTHRGVLAGGKVYDNIHTNGIAYDEWLKDFHTPSGKFTVTKTDF